MARSMFKVLMPVALAASLLVLAPVAVGWFQFTPDELQDVIERRQMRAVFDGDGRFIGAVAAHADAPGHGDNLQELGYLPAPAVLPPVFVAALRVLEDRGHDEQGLQGACGLGIMSTLGRVVVTAGKAGGSGFMAQSAKRLVAAAAPPNALVRWVGKLHQVGVACRLHGLLSAPGDQAASEKLLHLYASMVPMLQGNGTTSGLTAASWILFGHGPDALTDAQQLLLAGTPKMPLMALRPGDEKIDCLLVHRTEGNASYDSVLARRHPARAVMCRVVLRALKSAPEVLQGERLQRARADLLQKLRAGIKLHDPWGGNTDPALLVNPVRRLSAALPQPLRAEVRREAARLAMPQPVKLAMAAVPQKRVGPAAPTLRVSMNLMTGQLTGLTGLAGLPMASKTGLDHAQAIGPLGPAVIVLAATLRESPGVLIEDGLVVDQDGVLRRQCDCAPLKCTAADAVVRMDVAALQAAAMALGPKRLARAAALLGIALPQLDAGRADQLADGSLRVPLRQWLFAAQAIHVASKGPAAQPTAPGPMLVVSMAQPAMPERPWQAGLTQADRALLRSALRNGVSPQNLVPMAGALRFVPRHSSSRAAEPVVTVRMEGDTLLAVWVQPALRINLKV